MFFFRPRSGGTLSCMLCIFLACSYNLSSTSVIWYTLSSQRSVFLDERVQFHPECLAMSMSVWQSSMSSCFFVYPARQAELTPLKNYQNDNSGAELSYQFSNGGQLNKTIQRLVPIQGCLEAYRDGHMWSCHLHQAFTKVTTGSYQFEVCDQSVAHVQSHSFTFTALESLHMLEQTKILR